MEPSRREILRRELKGYTEKYLIAELRVVSGHFIQVYRGKISTLVYESLHSVEWVPVCRHLMSLRSTPDRQGLGNKKGEVPTPSSNKSNLDSDHESGDEGVRVDVVHKERDQE